MYAFDAKLEACATLKERFVWTLFMGALFFILYGAANQYAHMTAPHSSFYGEWERQIPFVSSFIIPYMSSDVMFCIAFLLPQTRLELRTLSLRVLFIVVSSVLIFVFFPLQCAFTKPQTDSYRFLFNLLLADLPYNQLPSLHISFAVVLWASMREHFVNRLVKYGVALWLWLIALSTLFVYQHHFIDLPTGFLMGLCAIGLIPSQKSNPLLNRFMTPRSLKVGLYYLSGALVFLVGAFYTHSLFLLWIFVSLLLVSLAYAFGFNELIAGKNAQASWWQWALFAPYFIGTHLSWRWYKRTLPLFAQVQERVYVGRHPDTKEYARLKEVGVQHIVNLALEHQCHQRFISQTRFAFLDLTIPSTEVLHEVVLLIEKYKEEGVYVHCALGLSRSILAIGAWLMYQGYSLEQIHERLRQIRPAYVASKYMHVSLSLYATYLEEQKRG